MSAPPLIRPELSPAPDSFAQEEKVRSPDIQPTRRNLILEVRELCEQGDPRPVETVLSRHADAAQLESLVFDLIHEEYHQRDRNGRGCDPTEFSQRFSKWGIDFAEFLEAKNLLEKHRDCLILGEDAAWPECLGRFRLLGQLGRGSFAQVYLALDPALGHRPVVLKVGRDGAAEANTLGRLDHPNIVPVYSVHHDANSGITAVCMPYLGSATLENVRAAVAARPTPPRTARIIWECIQDSVAPEFQGPIRKSPPAWLSRGSYLNAVLHLGQELAEALAFVHEQGIVHRDLKPSNVLMTPNGRPMLLDFNLSRHKQLPDDKVAGTIVYMPPEQLAAIHPENRSNSPILIDERSDLFSLGVIVYELLAGEYPFGPVPTQENLAEAGADWFQSQQAGARPLREKNSYVDLAAARLIESCLAFEPKNRPRNARELAANLRRLVSPVGRTRRWASSHVPLLILGVSLILASAAGTTYLFVPKAPYSVRQLNLGWHDYHMGRYEDALEYFMRSVEADRSSADAHFGRGRTFLRLGHYESALADFEAADELAEGKDGRIKACLGYCLNLLRNSEAAISSYREAKNLDFASAEVLNNLGYSYMTWTDPRTKPDDCLDRAEDYFTQALRLNPQLQPAYYNRARVDLSRALLNPRWLPRQGLTDIHKAIELGPVSAPLYWDAARLSSLLAPREARPHPETFDFLNAAVDHGLDPKELRSDYIFHNLAADARFLAILQKKPGPNLQEEATKLVDPIKD